MLARPESNATRISVSGLLLLIVLLTCLDCSDSGGTVQNPDGRVDSRIDALQDPSIVVIQEGPVRGKLSEKSRAFLGIPYAEPPTGPLRWMSPVPHKAWSQVLDATQKGPACPQPDRGYWDFKTSEDCLTLNVWTPRSSSNALLPVYVYVHGGNWEIGSGAQPESDGQRLAEATNKIVVTLNYRLGPLGFLAHPALRPETGNFGILDQRTALQWVQRNIAAFGGDPNNVTLTGNSAGGWSMCLHLTSPGSKGLFHRVMMQSGHCLDGLWTTTESERQGARFAAQLGCDKASDVAGCMRSKSVDEVLNALPINIQMVYGKDYYWRANVDGKTLVGQPLDLVKAGSFTKVPVILGFVKDEGTLFAYMETGDNWYLYTHDDYVEQINRSFGSYATKVLEVYPKDDYFAPLDALAAVMGDAVFDCYARRTARLLAEAGVATYLYQFAAEQQAGSPYKLLRSYHTQDINYYFHYPQYWNITFNEAESNLSWKIIGYLDRYAKTGDPNTSGEVSWTPFTKASQGYIRFDLGKIEMKTNLKPEECDLWDTLPPAICGNGGCGAGPLPN